MSYYIGNWKKHKGVWVRYNGCLGGWQIKVDNTVSHRVYANMGGAIASVRK